MDIAMHLKVGRYGAMALERELVGICRVEVIRPMIKVQR